MVAFALISYLFMASSPISTADDALVGGMIYCWVVFLANVVTLTSLFAILKRMKTKRRRAQAGEVRVFLKNTTNQGSACHKFVVCRGAVLGVA